MTPWFDPTQWTATDWTAMGVVVPLAIAVVGVGAKRYSGRRAAEPRILFDPLQLYGLGQHSRTSYQYAIGFRIRNVGPGAAIRADLFLADEEGEVFSEHFTRAAILPGEELADWLGLRLEDQSHDPTPAQAERFLRECYAMCLCYDSLNRAYVFTPLGGGRVELESGAVPWLDAAGMQRYLSQFPSRGDSVSGMGVGPSDH